LQQSRQRRWSLKRLVLIGGLALAALFAAVGTYAGVTLYKIDHAVHHVQVAANLLSKGRDDLLAVVKGPHHTEEVYLFRTAANRTSVLTIPSRLAVAGAHGQKVPLSSIGVDTPSPVIAGLKGLGIPVGHYVGVDLHAVSPSSSLGQLATGKISMASLISHPTGTASLLEAVASHVYLGPKTSISALMSLTHVPVGTPVAVPTSTEGDGRVVLAAPAAKVLRHFL
jgi:hypothetical protein